MAGDCVASRSEATKTALPTGDPRRSAYCINKKNFGSDRDGLEQDEDNITRLATADALPGLKPEKLAAAKTALTAWRTADQTQRKAVETQGKLVGQLEKKVAEINAKRRQIQLAADTAWPHTDPDNAAVRRAFKIPARQPVA